MPEVSEVGEIGEELPSFEPVRSQPRHIGNNLFTLPHQIAMAHDAAQARKLGLMNEEIRQNNLIMRQHLYPILHEIEAYVRQNEDNYDVSELEDRIVLLNELYQQYREEFMKEAGDGAIQDGALNELFPEDLTDISLHELKKIEGKIKEWLDHCKNFNSQKTQDLYLMIQIGVALLTAFQNAQKEMSQSANFMVHNQKY